MKYTYVMRPGINRQTFGEWLRFTVLPKFKASRQPEAFLPPAVLWTKKGR